METKGLLSSLGVWGGLLALVPGLGQVGAILGVIDPAAITDAYTQIAAGVGALLAIWGRIRATKAIKGLF